MNNPVIAQDNRPIHRAIKEAHKRGIRIWLGVVCNMFQIPPFDIIPCLGKMCETMGVYDQDQEGIAGRMADIFEDIVEMFPQADGLIIEMENVDSERPHRVKLYDEWAVENHEIPFSEIKIKTQAIDMRWQKQFVPFRKFLTDRRGGTQRAFPGLVFLRGQPPGIKEACLESFVFAKDIAPAQTPGAFCPWRPEKPSLVQDRPA